MSINHYFESIGAWPTDSRHMERTYVIGFLISLTLTLGAYIVAVYDVVSREQVVAIVLVAAGVQFIVQVMSFLHVSHETSSRERLVALGAFVFIMLILVLGSMWIMVNLDARMMPGADEEADEQMEMYMQHEQGI